MNRNAWRQALTQRWSALQPRERLGLQAAAALLGLWLIVSQMLWPSWRTLRDAPQQHQRLDAQIERMQVWRAQAEALKNKPTQRSASWREELSRSLKPLGQAQLSWNGNTALVTVQQCPPEALGRWLSELGPQWRLQVEQASLQLDEQGQWQGQISLSSP